MNWTAELAACNRRRFERQQSVGRGRSPLHIRNLVKWCWNRGWSIGFISAKYSIPADKVRDIVDPEGRLP